MSDRPTTPNTDEAQARFEEWRRIQPNAPSWDELSETARENWMAAVRFDRKEAKPADTAALRRFADRYEERTRRDLRAAGLPKEGDMPGPADLIRAAADELDRLRAGQRAAPPRYEPTGSPDGGPWGYDWIRRIE